MKYLFFTLVFFASLLYSAAQIYTKPQVFQFEVKMIKGKQTESYTVELECTGGKYYHKPSKLYLKDYYPIRWTCNKANETESTEETSVVENSERIFLHPIRFAGKHEVLEFCPFPQMYFPLEVGKSWKWELKNIPEVYYRAILSKSRVETTVKSVYTVTRKFWWFYLANNQSVECFEIVAAGTTAFGETSLKAYFSPVYGFVYLDYYTLNKDRYIFTLTKHFANSVNSKWN